MAKELGSKSLTLTEQERTCAVHIHCAFGADPQIVFERERLSQDPSGNIIKREQLFPNSHTLSAIKDDAVTVNGIKYTPVMIAQIISAYGDFIADKDEKFRAAEEKRIAESRKLSQEALAKQSEEIDKSKFAPPKTEPPVEAKPATAKK